MGNGNVRPAEIQYLRDTSTKSEVQTKPRRTRGGVDFSIGMSDEATACDTASDTSSGTESDILSDISDTSMSDILDVTSHCTPDDIEDDSVSDGNGADIYFSSQDGDSYITSQDVNEDDVLPSIEGTTSHPVRDITSLEEWPKQSPVVEDLKVSHTPIKTIQQR
jgi:hypothetical protein